jgi:hypothetical protein
MPSTYIHFWVAGDVAAAGALSLDTQSLADSYLCGTAAPDIHLLGGPPRPATHFWEIGEPVPGHLGASRLMAAYPHLIASRLDPVERAFVAGYLCHLAVDEAWIRTIYVPLFGPDTPLAGPEGVALQQAFYSVLERRLSDAGPAAPAIGDTRGDWLGALRRAAELPLRAELPPFTDLPVLHRWLDALLSLAAVRAGPARLRLWEQLRAQPNVAPDALARAISSVPPSADRSTPDPLAEFEARASGIVSDADVARFHAVAVPEAAALVRDYLSGAA